MLAVQTRIKSGRETEKEKKVGGLLLGSIGENRAEFMLRVWKEHGDFLL